MVIPITKYGIIGMAMVLSIHYENPSFTFSVWLESNQTTGMDRPHQNKHSIRK